ncbi:MAG: LAGLIDADG family homing endonuclease [Patescibacteria group bacterium]|nr:LAGLIDADG family homing endonuclease [Patescibacteria group bacterium]
MQQIFPNNKISTIKRHRNFQDISVYSNRLSELLPWKTGHGSKFQQQAHVPSWIFKDKDCMRHCLRGLIQTDGSVYKDRGYLMVNFTNHTLRLARDVFTMMHQIGFNPTFHETTASRQNKKYTVRLAKNPQEFIDMIGLRKK